MDKGRSRDFSGFNKDFSDRMFERVRVGNILAREEFIRDHEQFICMVVGKVTGKTVVEKSTDEYKIGISAFDYAINSFEKRGYDEFLDFCEETLTEWITDFTSKDKNSLREEIVLLKNKMWEFGVSMEDLVKESPTSRSTIAYSIAFAKNLIVTEPIFSDFSLRKELDQAGTEKIKKLFHKKVRRNRKYIIAISLIFMSELEDLKVYLENAINKNLTIEKIGVVLEYSMEKVVFMTEHGRFIMNDSLKNYYIGQRIYFNEKTGIQKYVIRYSLVAAGVAAVVLIGYVAFNNISLDLFSNKTDKAKPVSLVVNSEKKQENVPKPEVSEKENQPVGNAEAVAPTSTPPNNNIVTEKDTVKPASDGTNAQIVTILENTPAPTKVQIATKEVKNTPAPKNTIKPTKKSNPTVAPIKASPSKKPVIAAAPTGYPTVKATGIPGVPRIKSDNYELKVGQDYTIRMYLNSGNNGTKWILYENGVAVSTAHNTDNTPNEQSVMRLFTAKKPGTYNYKCELINSFGTSTSSEITIEVK